MQNRKLELAVGVILSAFISLLILAAADSHSTKECQVTVSDGMRMKHVFIGVSQ